MRATTSLRVKDSEEATPMIEIPTHEWLRANFKNKAAATRYLFKECNLPVKFIAGYLDIPYRQAFGTVYRMKKESSQTHTCPVCRRQL